MKIKKTLLTATLLAAGLGLSASAFAVPSTITMNAEIMATGEAIIDDPSAMQVVGYDPTTGFEGAEVSKSICFYSNDNSGAAPGARPSLTATITSQTAMEDGGIGGFYMKHTDGSITDRLQYQVSLQSNEDNAPKTPLDGVTSVDVTGSYDRQCASTVEGHTLYVNASGIQSDVKAGTHTDTLNITVFPTVTP